MKVKFFAILAMVAGLGFAGNAMATPGNSGDGHGGCGNGQQTDGCGTSSGSNSSSSSSSSATQLQGQLQLQGQQQSQGQVAVGVGVGGDAHSVATALAGDNHSSSASTSAGGSANATGGAGGSATVGNVTTGGSNATVGNVGGGSANSGGNTFSNSYVNEAQKRNPVNSAFANGSSGEGDGMCRFGPGIGVQTIGFANSLSLPIFKDRDCQTIAKAKLLIAAGEVEAAVQYLSMRDAEINASLTLSRRGK